MSAPDPATPTAAEEHPGTGQPVGRRRAVFHSLVVSSVERLTADSVEVGFAVPEELADEYDYAPGQYVALRKELPNAEGELQELRRSYSLCAVPRRGELRIAIKRDLGGLFSSWANDELTVGDEIDVMSPSGAFISKHRMTGLNDPESIDTSREHTFVAVAAGSGITPSAVPAPQQGLQHHPGDDQRHQEGPADGERERQGVLGEGLQLEDDPDAGRDEQQLQMGQQRGGRGLGGADHAAGGPQDAQQHQQHDPEHHPGHGQTEQGRRGQAHQLREQQDHEAEQHRRQEGGA